MGSHWFRVSQHDGLPSLRGAAPDPHVERHSDTARAWGIAAGDWVSVETPRGSARAALTSGVDPVVVVDQAGWWQDGPDRGLPGYPTFGDSTANSTTCCVSSRATWSAAARRCARRCVR